MRIQHNIAAMNAYRNFVGNNNALAKNLEKLSSGYRINRAGDDAAGLAISEKMRAQISGLDQAQKNVKDGISLVKTAEGALQEVQDMMNRMVTLATQSANGTYQNAVDRENLQAEVDALKSEIDRIAESSNFNGQKLLNGDLGATTSGTMSVTSSSVNVSDGITIDAPKDGTGGKEKFVIDFKVPDGSMFTAGDTVTIDLKDGTSVDFVASGATLADQLTNLAAQITADTTNFANYDVSVSGGKITLEANAVDADVKVINSVSVNDKMSVMNSTHTGGNTAVATSKAAQNMGWNNFLTDVAQLNAGDEVKFDFNVGGKTMTVTLKEGKDFAEATNVEDTIANIVGALKDANFDPNDTTVAFAEESLKVSDFFDIHANTKNTTSSTPPSNLGQENGSIMVEAKNPNQAVSIGGVQIGSNAATAATIGTAMIQTTSSGFTATVTTPGSAGAGTGTFALADTSIDMTASTALNVGQVATLIDQTQAGAATVYTGADGQAYTVKFVDAANATGALNEVQVDTTMGGDDLLVAIQDSLNAQAQQHLADKQATGTLNGNVKVETFAGVSTHTTDKYKIDFTQSTPVTVDTYTLTDVASTQEKMDITMSENFAHGEKLTIEGKLTDGRDFSVTLEAGTDFTIGTTLEDSLKAIADKLDGNVSGLKVNVDGVEGGIDASQIFGSGKEFTIDESNVATGKLTLNSTKYGAPAKGFAPQLTNVKKENAATITASGNREVTGGDPTSAKNVLTFDASKIEEGTTITIDGKTYEFVTDANKVTTDGAIAVEVSGLGSEGLTDNDVAEALKTAIGSISGYNMTVDGGTLTIESTAKGQGNEAIDDIAMGGAQQKSSVVTFNTVNEGTYSNPNPIATVQAGDTVTINGKTYEFTDGSRTKDEKNYQVKLDEIAGPRTAAAVADALAKVVNDIDGANTVARVVDGSVVLTSKFNVDADTTKGEDPYAAPTVSLPTSSSGLTLQIGDTAEEHNRLEVSIGDMHTKALGIADIDIGTLEGAQKAIETIKTAINTVSSTRGNLGAIQNRLEHTTNNLSVMKENITDAESSIRDTDMADEMTTYTKNNILIQAAQAMLAQANQQPQGVLQLLQ